MVRALAPAADAPALLRMEATSSVSVETSATAKAADPVAAALGRSASAAAPSRALKRDLSPRATRTRATRTAVSHGANDVTRSERLQFARSEDRADAMSTRTIAVEPSHALDPIDGSSERRRGTRRERRRRARAAWLSPPAASPSPSHRPVSPPEAPAESESDAAHPAALPSSSSAHASAPDGVAAAPPDGVKAAPPDGDAAWGGGDRQGSVRLVVVSDTHGFERQLGTQLLPPGDVLIHCGDWCGHGSAEAISASALQLDEWLASQPHEHKVVVRGNHDPPTATFPRSDALYATEVMSVELAGVTFALAPYFLPGRLRGRLPAADVLVSHVPPRGVLDLCTSGDRAGSDCLRRAVERATEKPRVWLCGHIHEASGAERVRFGRGAAATVVVNAANANPGLAKRLVLGPVVVDVNKPGAGSPDMSPLPAELENGKAV